MGGWKSGRIGEWSVVIIRCITDDRRQSTVVCRRSWVYARRSMGRPCRVMYTASPLSCTARTTSAVLRRRSVIGTILTVIVSFSLSPIDASVDASTDAPVWVSSLS